MLKNVCVPENVCVCVCEGGNALTDRGWSRATENRFFASSDRFLVCETNSVCIKHIFFQSENTHFADHILAQLPGLVKCQTVNFP